MDARSSYGEIAACPAAKEAHVECRHRHAALASHLTKWEGGIRRNPPATAMPASASLSEPAAAQRQWQAAWGLHRQRRARLHPHAVPGLRVSRPRNRTAAWVTTPTGCHSNASGQNPLRTNHHDHPCHSVPPPTPVIQGSVQRVMQEDCSSRRPRALRPPQHAAASAIAISCPNSACNCVSSLLAYSQLSALYLEAWPEPWYR